MNNHIQHIEISNFKSIKDLKIDDCKKINVLVGFPNAGKSNILEALAVHQYCLDDARVQSQNDFDFEKYELKDIVRFEKFSDLFYDGNFNKNTKLVFNNYFVNIEMNKKNYSYEFGLIDKNNTTDIPFVKKYIFNENNSSSSSKDLINLSYPFGENLGQIISSNPELRNSVNQFFVQNNLKLLIERGTNELKIFKEYQDGTVFTLPYNMIADTLQRLIFYKTAIMSNHDSVLLFEEPEAHCFEPYILEFTNEVKYNENNNQFFIVTHSDFIIQELLRDEESKNNTQIFLVNNVDGETKIKKLDAEKNEEVYEYGMNVFFNFENLWENN